MTDQDTPERDFSGSPEASPSDRLIDAALALAGERGWRGLTMATIADRAGIALNDALRLFGSRNDVLRAMGYRVDAAMLDEALGFTEADSPRDRLFDMLMRRYDALTPLRPGLAAIIRDLPADPVTFLVSMQGVNHSMGLALEAAGLPSEGIGGLAARKGLAAVYLKTMLTWTKDDTADNATTMAALDKNLDRAESVITTLRRALPLGNGCGCSSRRRREEEQPPVDPGAGAGETMDTVPARDVTGGEGATP